MQAGLAGAGLVVLAAALAIRLPFLVAPAMVLLAGAYVALFLVRGKSVDTHSPIYGVGLLASAELAYLALEHRAAPFERGLALRRTAAGCLLAIAGVGLSALVLAAAAAPVGGGGALEAVGIAAAIGMLALVGRLADSP